MKPLSQKAAKDTKVQATLEQTSKPWWKSRTLIGVAALILSQILGRLHIAVVPDDVTEFAAALLTTFGGVLAVFGRLNAQHALRLCIALAAVMLTGCAKPEAGKAGAAVKGAYDFYNDHYDRALSISTTTDGKPQVSYTISPKAAPATLTDAQIAQLMAHFATYAAQDGKAVVTPETK